MTDRTEAMERLGERARILTYPRWARGVRVLPRYVKYEARRGGPRVRQVTLPTFWGGQFSGVMPERVTIAIARYEFFDQNLCRSMLRFLRPGDTMVDVGAHYGFFSLLASWAVGADGRVLAIEAIGSTFERLQINVTQNSAHPNIRCVHSAAGNELGELVFKNLGLEYSSLNTAFSVRGPKAEQAMQNARDEVVPMRTLDSLLQGADLDQADFIKIDAESSEHLVLQGAHRFLTEKSPLISIEVSDQNHVERDHSHHVIENLQKMGYKPFRVTPDGLRQVARQEPIGYANFLLARADDERLGNARRSNS